MIFHLKQLLIHLYFLHPPLVSAILAASFVFGFFAILPLGLSVKTTLRSFLPGFERIGAMAFLITFPPLVLFCLWNASPEIGDTTYAVISWIWIQGGSIYHQADSPMRYALLYGPLTYMMIGCLFKLFGPSLFAIKGLTFVSSAISLVGLWCLQRPYYSKRIAVISLAFFGAFITNVILFPHFILLFVVCALLCYERLQGIIRGIAIGLLAGLAISVKIHGGFYFLPIFISLLFSRQWVPLIFSGITTIAAALTPFLLKGISLSNYCFWLSSAAKHGLSWSMFIEMSEWLAFGIFLIVAFRFLSGASLRSDMGRLLRQPFTWGLCASVVITLIFASKPGSGYHHLIPLFPSIWLLFAKWGTPLPSLPSHTESTTQINTPPRDFILLIMCFVWLLSILSISYQSISIARIPIAGLTADLNHIILANPHTTIALGDSEPTPHSWSSPKTARLGVNLKYIPEFQGNPILYETGALMDMQKADIPIPKSTIALLASGYVQLWLFPKGLEPFRMVNWYTENQQVFSPEFRNAFYKNFQKQGSSQYYDLWYFRPATLTY